MFSSLPDAPNKREQEQASGEYKGMFYDLPDEPEEQPESGFMTKMVGALTKGEMNVARGVMKIPEEIATAFVGPEPKGIHKRKFVKEYDALVKDHERGVESIIKYHPQWAYEPPKNFVDLVTSPDKLALAIAESTPLLINAGILTAAGTPQLATTMMFAVEGQDAKDQALASGATEDEANQAYFIYGSVAAVIEQMQLGQFMKLGKAGYNAVLNRSVQKLAGTGLQTFKKQFIKTVVGEALEEATQGTWGEVTAKLVYGKGIEGGVAGFIDRRAQEALLGGSMALLMGSGAVTAGRMASSLSKDAQIEPESAAAVVRSGMEAVDTEAPVEEQHRQFTEAAEQAFMVERKISRFSGKITDSASLKKIGTDIAADLGVDVEGVPWIYKSVTGHAGASAQVRLARGGRPIDITVKVTKGLRRSMDVSDRRKWAGAKSGRVTSPSQSTIKRTIIHELGHIAKRGHISKKGAYIAHHPAFAKWVNENVPKLLGTVKVQEGKPRSTALGRTVDMAAKPLKRVYMKGFAARLTSIRNNADNIIAGAGEKGSQLKIIKEELSKVQQHYESIAEDIKENPELLAELDQINKLLPDYSRAVDNFISSPSKEGFEEIKVVGGEIAELSTGYGARIGEQAKMAAKPVGKASKTELAKWIRQRAKANEGTVGAPKGNKDAALKKVSEEIRRGEYPDELDKAMMQYLQPTKDAETGETLTWQDEDFPRTATLLNFLGGMEEMTAEELTPKEIHEQTLEELAQALDKRRGPTEDPIEKLNRRGVYKIIHGLKSLGSNLYQNFMRVERMLEGLDGHKEGAFYNKIWRPLKQADEFAVEATNAGMEEFIYRLEGQGIDTTLWLGKIDEIGPNKKPLTASQRIGIYTLSKNKNGMRYLSEGMNLTPDDIKAVLEFMGDDEKSVADWLLDQYEAQWPTLKAAAVAAGIDPKILKKEFRYSPILRTDADLEQQEDFLSGLADQYTRDSFSPEKKMLEERQKGAVGEIELDAFVMYMHNIARTERFKAMAPVTAKIGKILNNKGFKRQLNAATYGHGSKILSSWLKDTVRGTSSAANTLFQKGMAIARRNGIVYAIGYNLPSSMRQALSMSNAVATDPLMLKYAPINITKAMTPKGYAAIERFVYNRSMLVKTRSFERDLRQKWNKKTLGKKLRGKAPWSQTATSWIKWMDKHTTVVAWKSLYDTAMEKFNGDETKAEQYADKWISRTQPMANTKDLPQFFRGSGLEKLLTTFQNQINNNGNFYAYDIIGAKRADKISWKMVGYRTMFSYILPAMLFGIIGRARLPKTWKDVMTDLATYPIAPLLLVGRWMDRMIRGWGQSGTIAEAGPEELIKSVEALKRGNLKGFMFHAAKTIGAFTGTVTAQMVRTTEGALDMLAGSTKDPRRLVYSKWALEQGEQKGQKRGRRRAKRKRPTRRTRRRR